MAVCRVLNVITRLEQGGAPLALLETVDRMDRTRFDVTIAAGQTEDEDRILDLGETAYDLPVVDIPYLRRSIHPIRDLIALLGLIRAIRRGRYDIVHTHTSKAGLLGRIAAYLCRVPAIIHSSHGTVLQGYFSLGVTRLFAFLERVAAPLSDRIICLTRREIEQYLEAGIGDRERFTYIFNGIDLSKFEARKGDRAAIRSELGFDDDDILCVTAGRLAPVKGQSDLLTGFAAAREENPSLKLVVIGDGELRDDLEGQATALGIAESTRFLGWRDDVAELLDGMDLFALTSLNEGLGLAIIEAMAKRLPVVATSVGGVPEVVDDGQTGLLVRAEDHDAIAEAITRLASDVDLRKTMGARGYERAHEHFSIEQTVQNTEALYEQLWRANG